MAKSGKKIDIGIITALPDIELPAVLKTFDLDPKRHEDESIENHRYWFSSIQSLKTQKNLKIVITSIGTSGNIASASATKTLIRNYNPNLLVLVGIAAGLKNKVNLLDVVISENVVGYEYERLTPEGKEQRPKFEHPPHHILQDIRFFEQQVDTVYWNNLFKTLQASLDSKQLPLESISSIPKALLGTVASGEKLLADGSLADIQKKYDEKIRAGEMEGIGFSIVSEQDRIPWIVIRGISDFGDPSTKDGRLKDQYHFSAANSASSWLRIFLESAYSGSEAEVESKATSTYNEEISEQILNKLKNIIAMHGLDDNNWAKAISSQYFLFGIGNLLNMTDQNDYKNLLDKFLKSFHKNIENKMILEKENILVTPKETEKIMECMEEEDKKDKYYLISEKTKAENINPWMLHYNYLYGLSLKISSLKEYEALYDIHKLAIDELIYGDNGNAIDGQGGWCPYRIPWITARILISFKDSYYSEREDAKLIEKTINKALESLIRRIYDNRCWRSGVGIWVSKWESTSLCLEALYQWDYISKNKLKIKKILNYIIDNEKEWMIDPPSFESQESSNDTLASIVLICVILQIVRKNFNSDEFSLDYDKYIRYLDKCVNIITSTSNLNTRQFCTIPQIAYYIVNLLKYN